MEGVCCDVWSTKNRSSMTNCKASKNRCELEPPKFFGARVSRLSGKKRPKTDWLFCSGFKKKDKNLCVATLW